MKKGKADVNCFLRIYLALSISKNTSVFRVAGAHQTGASVDDLLAQV